jgi:uncharacterized protein YjlB
MNLKITLIIIFVFGMINTNAQINKNAEMVTLSLTDNGNFPNNQELPVLVYKKVFDFTEGESAATIEKVFSENNWGGSWRNGIYSFQHYHSTAHEALGIYGGWAQVQLGGPGNKPVRIEKGDLVVLPAGTAHKKISSGDGFAVVGAYPDGQTWDMNYGKDSELAKTKQNIANVALPKNDPVFGKGGKMFEYWK